MTGSDAQEGSAMDTTAIRIEGLTKTYGAGDLAVHALRGIDLEIRAGEFVVILGPSGSGKTTLMNVIGGIEPPTAGRITVRGREITALDDDALTDYRRTEVGFIFQFFNLIPTLTAAENVALVAELVGDRDPDLVLTALRSVALDDRADRFPGALSGGEQQRVAIARALVKHPAILLCDEPTGALDLENGRGVLATLHGASRAGGQTVILVTHNSAIATMADRVLRMGSGQLLGDTPQPSPTPPAEVRW
ncbi:MAG: ABC transporter ATP-binding protein [Chloroflexi bacterium]|nr:ABC transporter ATP-binding protein [Chloroflexota bacterium]